MADTLKDHIDLVTKLKTLKAEALEALNEPGTDAAEEFAKAKRYTVICLRIMQSEAKMFELGDAELKEFLTKA